MTTLPKFTDLEIPSKPVPIYEEDTFDFSLFENKVPQPCYTHYDADTIELLDRDKYATGG